MKKNEVSLQDLRDSIKRNNLHIIKVQDGEEKEKGVESFFKDIMAVFSQTFPNLGRDLYIQVHEAIGHSKISIQNNLL